MASLNIDDETAESLTARAAAVGVSVDEFLRRLLSSPTVPTVATIPRVSLDELETLLDQEATYSPVLPVDFSRTDIYADHD